MNSPSRELALQTGCDIREAVEERFEESGIRIIIRIR
jgi:hypothetical protein